MIDSVILDTFKCVFFILFVVSMAGGFSYFLDMIRECGLRNEIERLERRVLELEIRSACDQEDDDDDEDDGK